MGLILQFSILCISKTSLGKPRSRSFQKALNKVYKELGWENKTGGMHEFRRTYATSLIGNVSDKSVQQWMGHKDWHTTMQYYEYVEKTPDPDAAATVSQAIWG